MARECKKCGAYVPKWVVVDGKQHNCQRRKYCLKCSPFGQHNTRKLELVDKDRPHKNCDQCGRSHTQKGRKCFACFFALRSRKVAKKVGSLIGGYKCWICGYDKCKRNLHFHHVDEQNKLFNLTTRELMLKWDRVWLEMQKCVLLCSNCHGECHEGLIAGQAIEDVWTARWNAILAEFSKLPL